jgi:hypothetical protein
MSPNGSHIFMSLPGPNPLTADPHAGTGATPGVGGHEGPRIGPGWTFEAVAPVRRIDAAGNGEPTFTPAP